MISKPITSGYWNAKRAALNEINPKARDRSSRGIY